MPEIETEEEQTRAEVAARLRDLADEREGDGAFTLELGGQSVTLDPVDPVTLKMEGEWGEGGAGDKESIEFELVWWQATEAEGSEPAGQ
ncbi:MAG TPA: amphi-Trp domain-containing protein [Halobacteriales archaeon]|nr:amphi-Trp domain-containing protein [Halobacteriales archaeon]